MSKKEEQNLELELLKAQLETLKAQVGHKKDAQQEYQERLARYEANKEYREKLKADIERRRMEIWQANPRLKSDEVAVIEGLERRSKQAQAAGDLNAKAKFDHAIKMKLKEVAEDITR